MIRARALTAEAFAPFGQVLQGSGAPAERKAFASRMHNARPGAVPNMTYMRVPIDSGPVRITALERHPHSNQTFIPLNGTRQLIVVCAADASGAPARSTLQGFIAEGFQAINYDANVWHAPRVAVSAPGEFIMFRWDDGSAADTEWLELGEVLLVEL